MVFSAHKPGFLEYAGFSLLFAGGAALLAPVVSAQSDRNRACVQNLYQITPAVLQYAQDYDERLPRTGIWNDPARFQSEIAPYLGNATTAFHCPATRGSYLTNAAIAGQSLASFADIESVEALRDSRPHADGKLSVGFLSGRVERGGVDQEHPDSICFTRVSNFNTAILQYAQDYDEFLPHATTDVGFRNAVSSYVRSSRNFTCPETLRFYTINDTIRGKSLNNFSEPATVETVADPVRHKSGALTTGYLSGRVRQVNGRGAVIRPQPQPPAAVSVSRLKSLGLAMLQYSQDYDEKLPPMQNMAVFQAATRPYIRDTSAYTAPGVKPFEINSELSGVSLTTVDNVAATIWIRDTNIYGDGKFSYGFVDGHVERR